MKKTKQQLVYEEMHKFCKAHSSGEQIFVGGMWAGDFIGTIVSFGISEATFRVDKPLSESAILKEYTFPYGKYLNLRELTDEEKQMDIAEVYGSIHV